MVNARLIQLMNCGRERMFFSRIIVVVLMVTTHDNVDIGTIAVVELCIRRRVALAKFLVVLSRLLGAAGTSNA